VSLQPKILASESLHASVAGMWILFFLVSAFTKFEAIELFAWNSKKSAIVQNSAIYRQSGETARTFELLARVILCSDWSRKGTAHESWLLPHRVLANLRRLDVESQDRDFRNVFVGGGFTAEWIAEWRNSAGLIVDSCVEGNIGMETMDIKFFGVGILADLYVQCSTIEQGYFGLGMKDLKLFPTLEAQPPHHQLGVCAIFHAHHFQTFW
jgi:hypothetical protein